MRVRLSFSNTTEPSNQQMATASQQPKPSRKRGRPRKTRGTAFSSATRCVDAIQGGLGLTAEEACVV